MFEAFYRIWKLARLGVLFTLIVGSASLVSAGPLATYKLSSDGPLPIGGDVEGFIISADSHYLVYAIARGGLPDIAQQRLAGDALVINLYSVPMDGSKQPRLLNNPQGNGGNGLRFIISNDSSQVIYGPALGEGLTQLINTAIDDRSKPVPLDIPLAEGRVITDFNLSPDDSRVVYTADQDLEEVVELYATTLPDLAWELFLPLSLR